MYDPQQRRGRREDEGNIWRGREGRTMEGRERERKYLYMQLIKKKVKSHKYPHQHHAAILSPENASLAFTSAPLDYLHLSQNPPQLTQDNDSFKVQVL